MLAFSSNFGYCSTASSILSAGSPTNLYCSCQNISCWLDTFFCKGVLEMGRFENNNGNNDNVMIFLAGKLTAFLWTIMAFSSFYFFSCNFHNNAVVTFLFPAPILFYPPPTVSAFATEKEIYICSKKPRCVFLCMSIFAHMHITDGLSCCYLLVYFNHSILTWENKACEGKAICLERGAREMGHSYRDVIFHHLIGDRYTWGQRPDVKNNDCAIKKTWQSTLRIN